MADPILAAPWRQQTKQLMDDVSSLIDDADAIGNGMHDDSRILLHARSVAAEVGSDVPSGDLDAHAALSKVYDVQALLKGAAAIAPHPGVRVICEHAIRLLDGADALLDRRDEPLDVLGERRFIAGEASHGR